MKKGKQSRVIFLSSCFPWLINDLSLETLNGTRFFEFWNAVNDVYHYSISKLCAIIAAKNFGEKLRGTGVTVYSVNPGAVRTDIFTHGITSGSYPFSFIYNIFYIVGLSKFAAYSKVCICCFHLDLEMS